MLSGAAKMKIMNNNKKYIIIFASFGLILVIMAAIAINTLFAYGLSLISHMPTVESSSLSNIVISAAYSKF